MNSNSNGNNGTHGREWELPEEESAIARKNPIWITIYSDMMTNLMLFFLMMFGMSRVGFKELQLTQASVKELVTGKVEPMLLKEKRDREERKKFEEKIPPGWEKVAKVEAKKNAMRVVFQTPVLFDLGRAELKPGTEKILDPLCAWLSDVDYRIVVEGHTDNLPVSRGAYRSNWELSIFRARSVVEYLSSHGLPRKRLVAAGYGEYRPVAPNDSPGHRGLNRRIELTIYYEDPEKT